MPHRPRSDDGTTHVLEAIIIACVMLSAVAFVVTFENPTTGSTATRDLLEKKAEDALSLLHDTPVKDSTYGDNLLSVLIAQCMQGTCDNLTAKLDKLLPMGTSYALYVSNGYETYPVLVEKEPVGEAVTSKVLLEPKWSYTFTSTGLSVINNKTDPQLLYALPVYNSNVVSPGGSPLKITVKGIKQSDGSPYTLEAFYTTEAVASTQAGQVPAVSMNFLVDKTGGKIWDDLDSLLPGAYWTRTDEVLTSTGHPNNESIEFRIALNESANVAIPAGTELTVNIPRGWNASGWNDTNWQVIQDATDWNSSYNGSDVIARLLRPVMGESVEFRFNATYRGDLLRFYPFRATLTRGAAAEANLLVEADTWPENTQTFAMPRVIASVPRPMGATAETTWSLAVNLPYHPVGGFVVSKSSLMRPGIPTGNPTSIVSGVSRTSAPTIPLYDTAKQTTNIIITSVTIQEQNGASIFDRVIPGRVGHGHGMWTSYGDRLVWQGMHNTTSQFTLNLTFNVTGKGQPGTAAPKAFLTPPIGYSTFQGRLLHQTAPGLFRDAILPNNTTASYYETGVHYRGYDPAVADPTTPLLHTYASSPTYRGTYLRGDGNYTVNPVSPFTDALYGSYVAVDKRNVPIGGQVVLTADVQSMLYALSAAGQSAGVNLTFYPPWSGDSKIPIWSQKNLDSGILASSVVQVVMLDMNADGFPDPVVGTDQGRVIGFNGLTGERLQGNTWIAPILDGQSGVAVIKHLSLITLGGEDYVVVGTDGKSGVYILDKQFNAAWSWSKTADTATLATTAIDATSDIDGDGRRDLAVALENGAVYVLRALSGNAEMQPLAPAAPPPSPFGAFNKSQGTPAAILGLGSVGQAGTPGIAVSLVSIPGADLNLRLDKDHPEQTSANPQLTIKTPRAGLTVFDNVGATAWTFLNTPVNVMRPYAYDADGKTDLLLGSASGHVIMLSGERGASPLASAIWTPVQGLVDADARDLAHSVWLTEDGTIAFSYDGWTTHNCVSCDPVINGLGASYPSMNGIALNSTMGIWAAGDNSMLLRATEGMAPGYPWMSLVVPNATKAGVSYNFNLSLHKFHDIHFDWGPQGDNGWVVGEPLPPALCVAGVVPLALLGHCDEGLLMRTTNGGQSWTILSALDPVNRMNATAGAAEKVTAPLTRVNFTTDAVGWVVGDAGTLLRSTDGGATFQQLSVPTTADLRDVSCDPRDPNVCIVVGEAGVALRSTDATSVGPSWTNISASLNVSSRDLYSVGLVSGSDAYVGLENKILHTLDAGQTWTEMPMGYIQSSATRMSIFPDGTGFIWGGNETSARQWWLHDHARSATAHTKDVTASLPLPADAKVFHASAWVAATAGTGTSYEVYLSANGNATWNRTIDTGDGQTATVENTVPVALARDKWSTNFSADVPIEECATCTNDVRVRIDLGTTPDISAMSAFVSGIEVEVRYLAGGTITNRTYTVSLADTSLRGDATTAAWNPDVRAIYLPLVKAKFWATNVSGGVLDVQTGHNVQGDARPEIWVATGDVIAENSPDHVVYAGSNTSRYIDADNRIYLLDGATGSIVARTAKLPGNVLQIRLVDMDGDGVADRVLASVAKGSFVAATIRAFDARTLAAVPHDTDPDGWTYVMDHPSIVVNDLEIGINGTREPSVVLGRSGQTSGTPPTVQGGSVEHIAALDHRHQWMSRVDVRGIYVITKDVPKNWFFGPYVVEVKVDWEDTVQVTENGNLVNKTIVQSAQFYDYFMVTPPDALNPPNPLYTVHLVSWFRDWR